MVGRLIPAGTGLTYHKNRKAKRLAEAAEAEGVSTVSADEVEQALAEALNTSGE